MAATVVYTRRARHMLLSRRHLLAAIAALCAPPRRATADETSVADRLRAIEARNGGRLGVCILDTGTGRLAGHRLDEPFAMCSTFKLPLAAVVLREADTGRLKLDERLPYSEKDMLSHAPVTREHLAEGAMTIGALIEAAQVTSDNVAANLLITRLGGPGAFTAMLRALGDRATRLDRYEPMMNFVAAGEAHDTTTPRAMATTMARFLTGDLLTASSRDTLIAWMVATRTGSKRIRAGLPNGWRAGDKTGTASADGMTNKVNDVAITWPPGGAALIVAAYYDASIRSQETRPEHEAVLAAVGRVAATVS